jgi:Arc/MetJ-type ribon-helix-helix transcriptional regulator
MRQAVRRLLLDEKTGKVRWQRLKRLIEAYAEKGSEVSAEFSEEKMKKAKTGRIII